MQILNVPMLTSLLTLLTKSKIICIGFAAEKNIVPYPCICFENQTFTSLKQHKKRKRSSTTLIEEASLSSNNKDILSTEKNMKN